MHLQGSRGYHGRVQDSRVYQGRIAEDSRVQCAPAEYFLCISLPREDRPAVVSYIGNSAKNELKGSCQKTGREVACPPLIQSKLISEILIQFAALTSMCQSSLPDSQHTRSYRCAAQSAAASRVDDMSDHCVVFPVTLCYALLQ